MDLITLLLLVVVLVINNIAWLYFFSQHSKENKSERWALQERIREPNQMVFEPAQYVAAPEETIINPQPEDEFDAVGRIDPPLPLRDED